MYQPTAGIFLFPPRPQNGGDGSAPEPIPLPELPPPMPEEGEPGIIPHPLMENAPLLANQPWSYQPTLQDWLFEMSEVYDNSLSSFIADVPSLSQRGWDYVNQETREKFYQFGEWVKQKASGLLRH
ncbi:hypothetical protein [Thorsellia kenyensis]|uniref:Uncharacterized protein n=1 Tax=Thorsellia kenyensis TaxID=1549888 RepID=A0ABV6CC97_9GAMM